MVHNLSSVSFRDVNISFMIYQGSFKAKESKVSDTRQPEMDFCILGGSGFALIFAQIVSYKNKDF